MEFEQMKKIFKEEIEQSNSKAELFFTILKFAYLKGCEDGQKREVGE